MSQDAPTNPPPSQPWFRDPDRREHWIAAGLFLGFGIFFVMLFVFQRGWWFRWVILGLAMISILHGARHGLDAMRTNR